MSKGGAKNQTVTQALDPQTQAMQQQIYNSARNAAGYYRAPGITPETQGAINNFGMTEAQAQPGMQALDDTAALGTDTGLKALMGTPGYMSQLMNPYTQNVMDSVLSRFGTLSQRVSQNVNAEATGAGAYGGSRAAIADGVAQGELGQTAQQQLAQLAQSGYGNAQGVAQSLAGMGIGAGSTLANLGFSSNQQLANLGDYERQVQIDQNPFLTNLNLLKSGVSGMPYGQSTSQPINRPSPLTGALGGAAALSGLGPWGAVAGGLMGLFQ